MNNPTRLPISFNGKFYTLCEQIKVKNTFIHIEAIGVSIEDCVQNLEQKIKNSGLNLNKTIRKLETMKTKKPIFKVETSCKAKSPNKAQHNVKHAVEVESVSIDYLFKNGLICSEELGYFVTLPGAKSITLKKLKMALETLFSDKDFMIEVKNGKVLEGYLPLRTTYFLKDASGDEYKEHGELTTFGDYICRMVEEILKIKFEDGNYPLKLENLIRCLSRFYVEERVSKRLR